MKMMMTVIKIIDHDYTDVTMLIMVGDDGSADGGGGLPAYFHQF